MAAPDAIIKNIRIKTGVVKRIAKEKNMYEKEAQMLQERVEKMKAEGRDEHDIKKQQEVTQESNMMIPDCVKRLKAAMADLGNLLDSNQDLCDAEEYKAAKNTMNESASVLTGN
ncbi:PREDICTED: tubulin-specific chaperone A-like [Priapulus caudatus]|uniref:Tubulin-specific chaperone A n=1 Tax=Priapulus caudatus TaxID=37621 RepID=A0ABM1E823_PRICU|nr:PREDICTED: tubulin-specific chaperone A-like [Priapulus caudatus]